MNELPSYVLEREFDAPRELVWKAWTDPQLIGRWYGPGVETITHKLDASKGGEWLCEMKMRGGSGYQKAEYTEVTPPERLVWLHTTTDADWNTVSNPMMPNWPNALLSTLTLTEDGGKTAMTFTWIPHQPSDAEIECFAGSLPGLDKAWGAGMDGLAKLLAELQS